MASLKKLAGETIWYGLSNIASKLLNQLVTPIVTYILNNPAGMVDYGNVSVLYAGIAFANVVFTYGLETAYFRFAAAGTDKKKLFNTTFSSLLATTSVLSLLLVLLRQPIADFFGIADHPEYIVWCVLIIAIDALAAIPFALLRQEQRPRKYAFAKVLGIVVNIALTVLLIKWAPQYTATHPGTAFAHWHNQYTATGFLIMANLVQSIITFLLLVREWSGYRFSFDAALWKRILAFCSPMIIVGLGGMVNETLDRIMLSKLYAGTEEAAKTAVGIYSANYKIAIFISLFIQAFKMSAEPFFFSRASDKNAPAIYARVMKWFVLTLCVAFLFTSLFLDLWQYFIGSQYRTGLGVVPILLMANVALGIYYNLSVWYKVTDRMRYGMYITLIGTAITLVVNYLFIPTYGMYACAWATLAAYGVMMLLSYVLGQRYFPVPYPVTRLLTYAGLIIALYFAQRIISDLSTSVFLHVASGVVLMATFFGVVLRLERNELKGLPIIGKYIGG